METCNFIRSGSLSTLLLVLIGTLSNAFGEMVKNPSLQATSIGMETLLFRWSQAKADFEGSYNADRSEYTLTGNGHAVYWCLDAATMALVDEGALTGEFTFTARIKEVKWPEKQAPGQVGIKVRGHMLSPAQVLSLRWDTYWAGTGETGLTWFNRIVPRDSLEPMNRDYAEKQCHGTGQGCRGKGYENTVAGYDHVEGLWLRVQRKIMEQTSQYFLSASYDGETWQEIESVAGDHNACKNDPLNFVPNHPLPHFSLPEDNNGEVFASLFVAHGSHGGGKVTATFDNISLETETQGEAIQYPPGSFSEDARWWPSYAGPNNTYSYVDSSGYEIVDDLAKARQIWKSEYIHPGRIDKWGRGTVWNPGVDTNTFRGVPSGGGAGPVAYDGKVYLYWYANHYDAQAEKWLEIADDVILCVDAVTGETIWKRVFEGAARDVAYEDGIGKSVMKNHTPVVYNDKLYVVNSIGKAYKMDPQTGEVEWTRSVSTPDNSALVGANDALVFATGGCRQCKDADLVAYDTEDGKSLWRISNAIGGWVTPTKWVYDDKEYILSASGETHTMRLIEPQSGDVLWKNTQVGLNSRYPVAAWGDYAIANIGGLQEGDDWQLAGFKISPEGSERIWTLPAEFQPDRNTIPIHDGRAYLYLPGPAKMLIVEIASGTILAEHHYFSPNAIRGGWTVMLDGKFYMETDGTHWTNEAFMMTTQPDDFRLSGTRWVPPHPSTSSYTVPMSKPYVEGRMFFRGYDAMYAYDLRKPVGSTTISPLRPATGLADNHNRLLLESHGSNLILQYLTVGTQPVTISFHDHMGKVIHALTGAGSGGRWGEIQTPAPPPGSYILKMQDREKTLSIKPVVVP